VRLSILSYACLSLMHNKMLTIVEGVCV